jgi:signal peptidase I
VADGEEKKPKKKALSQSVSARENERAAYKHGLLIGWLFSLFQKNNEPPSSDEDLTPFQAWRQRRRAVREGALLVKEGRRALKRFRHRLTVEAKAQVEAAILAFDTARKDTSAAGHDALVEAVNGLDKILDQHLSFARKSTGREYGEAIGTAVLIALFLRAFVVEAFKIPSGSMIPTLQVGDHIFVNKFIYGVRIPFTDVKIGTNVRRPHRGEVIVFIYPKDPDKDFIKRIVGVEGDVVEMRDGVLYVNDKAIDHAAVDGDCLYEDYDEQTDQWEERRCEGVQEHVGPNDYTTIYNRGLVALGPSHSTRAFKVPERSVFVMGDNRDNSHDSRFWGAVPEDLIKGKAMVIWWSQGDPDRETGPSALEWMRGVPVLRYLWGARYTRMFHLVR